MTLFELWKLTIDPLKGAMADFKTLRILVCINTIILLISYSVFIFLRADIVAKLGKEDGLFEFMTAVILFSTSMQFLILFLEENRIIYLLFSLLFIFGFGEEISWGQRLINFDTPSILKEVNRQGEFSLHNLPGLQGVDKDGVRLKGISVFLNLNFTWKIFCLAFGVLLPLLYLYIRPISVFLKKLALPIAPLLLGTFFVINYIIYFSLKFVFIHQTVFPTYERSLQEVSEFYASFVFLILSFYFILKKFRHEKNNSLLVK